MRRPPTPPPSLDEGKTETDQLLRAARPVPDRTAAAKADSWYRLRARAQHHKPAAPQSRLIVRWPVLFAYACAAALIAGGLYGWIGADRLNKPTARPPTPVVEVAPTIPPVAPPAELPLEAGWRRIDLGAVGQLTVSGSASLRLPASESSPGAGYTVGLDSGELCAAITHRDVPTQGPFVVEAASLRVVVVGTKFCVNSAETNEASWVSVQQGRVRVERDGQSAMVSAGETIHGDDSALAPPPVPSVHAKAGVARKTTSCPDGDPYPVRRRCLWRMAGGDDLAAQNALYLLGLLAKDQEGDGVAALSIWETYRHRFAHGVMSAEVDLAVVNELAAEGRYAEAVSVSDEFLAEFPTYFHAGEVRLKRAEILRTRLKRTADAEDAYLRILSTESSPSLRGEALFGLGQCQETMGLAAEARSTWNRYEVDFPNGRHSSEVKHRLGGPAPGP